MLYYITLYYITHRSGSDDRRPREQQDGAGRGAEGGRLRPGIL